MRRAIMAEKGAKPAGPYSHAIEANGFIFVSGQGPHAPETGEKSDNFAEQVEQTLRNLEVILKASGTDLAHVVKVNAYLTDLLNFAAFNEVYKRFFPDAPPARTTVATGLLGILVEIDCIAVLPES